MAVAVRLVDAGLARRIVAALDRSEDLDPVESPAGAEVLITDAESLDGVRQTSGAIILLGRRPRSAPANLKASLPENIEPGLIADAARLVAAGLVVFPAREEATRPDRPNGAEVAALDEPEAVTLTPREREVLELLAAGASNKAISRQLNISVHTAKFHVASLLDKLQASGRLEAVGIGLRTGLLML